MRDLVPLPSSWLPEGFALKSFRPSAMYIPGLDCLVYLARDCSYVATSTDNPYVERLMDNGKVVGFKIWFFLTLPSELRNEALRLIETMIDLDDLKGIEYIWMQNANEQDAEMSAGEDEFVKWLEAERAKKTAAPQ